MKQFNITCPQCGQIRIVVRKPRNKSNYCHICATKKYWADYRKKLIDSPSQSKKCTKCKIIKPLTEFNPRDKDASYPAYKSHCITCRNAQKREYCVTYYEENRQRITDFNRNWKYGVSRPQYEEMLSKQNNRCAICKGVEPKSRGSWCVDHDHSTGQIRMLLCGLCNTMLGHARDSTEILYSAIDYLEKHKVKANELSGPQCSSECSQQVVGVV